MNQVGSMGSHDVYSYYALRFSLYDHLYESSHVSSKAGFGNKIKGQRYAVASYALLVCLSFRQSHLCHLRIGEDGAGHLAEVDAPAIFREGVLDGYCSFFRRDRFEHDLPSYVSGGPYVTC